MSGKLVGWAFDQPLKSPTSKLVLVKLADNANDEGVCWPSQRGIARACSLSRESVNRHIKALEDSGYIRVERRVVDGVSLPSIYHLRGGGSNLGGVVSEDHGGGVRGSQGVVSEDHTEPSVQPSIEPKTPPTPSKPEPKPKTSRSAELTPEGVQSLWNAQADHRLPRCMGLNKSRRTSLNARLTEHPSLKEWETAIDTINGDSFFLGSNERTWRADIDYLIRPGIVLKLIERAATPRGSAPVRSSIAPDNAEDPNGFWT